MTFDVTEGAAVLTRTPAALRAMLGGLSDGWIRAVEGPDTFSPFDVVGHLIDGDESDWIGRATIILARDPSQTFQPFDRFRHRDRNAERTLDSLLDEFARLRAANLELLRSWNLGPAELALTGRHPKFGPVTLRQLLATWVAHDLGHLAQIARVMAKQCRPEVGPWLAFLPVLTDHEVPRS